MTRAFRTVLIAGLALLPMAAHAQGGSPTPPRLVQTGLAAVPGLGVQVGFVRARSLFTIEGLLSADASPTFAGGEGNVQVSASGGGSIRTLGIPRLFGTVDYPYDFDVGLRFGPSLFFATNATRSEKNQQFSLFIEPFLRFSSRLGNGRLYYIEAGTQRPLFRFGLWFGL